MSILPLPVFEADADPHHREAMSDEEIDQRLKPPEAIVVRLGYLGMIGEYPYAGDARPGCGSRLVARVAAALFHMGCYEISLGDTIGVGTPGRAQTMVDAVAGEVPRAGD